MRTSILAASAALLGLSCAQFTGTLPNCAKTCLGQFTSGSQIGDCNSLNIHCICSSADFLNGIACCLAANCDEADKNAAIQYAQGICSTANPPVVVPNEVVCNSTSSASSSGSVAPTASNKPESSGGVNAATTTPPASSSASAGAAASSSTAAAALNKVGGAGIGFAGGLAAALVLL